MNVSIKIIFAVLKNLKDMIAKSFNIVDESLKYFWMVKS